MNWNKQEVQEAFISRCIQGAPTTLYNIGVGPKSEYLTLKTIYPEMAVFGCEPLVSQYKGLKKRFNGELLEVAIGTKSGKSKIYFEEGKELCASMLKKGAGRQSKKIDVITLDEFDELCGKPERILLWADIEGMELSMLKSGPKLLASGRVRWINMEEHKADTETIESINALLEKVAFERTIEYNKHPGHQDVLYVHKDETGSR